MITIQLAHTVPAATVKRIEQYLGNVMWYDFDWSGVEFQVKRDDHTCIPDDNSPEAGRLLNAIQCMIGEDSENACDLEDE